MDHHHHHVWYWNCCRPGNEHRIYCCPLVDVLLYNHNKHKTATCGKCCLKRFFTLWSLHYTFILLAPHCIFSSLIYSYSIFVPTYKQHGLFTTYIFCFLFVYFCKSQSSCTKWPKPNYFEYINVFNYIFNWCNIFSTVTVQNLPEGPTLYGVSHQRQHHEQQWFRLLFWSRCDVQVHQQIHPPALELLKFVK